MLPCYSDTRLNFGQVLLSVIRPTNSVGEINVSNIASATTLLTPTPTPTPGATVTPTPTPTATTNCNSHSNSHADTNLGGTPVAPSNLVATAVSTTGINLTWQDNSNNETGFKFQRSQDRNKTITPSRRWARTSRVIQIQA